jgi:predicted enzyme related to lactoylglutathione lyase
MSSLVTVSSIVLYAGELERTGSFYRTVGVPLEHEDHDDGPAHFAAELGGLHFAVYASPQPDSQRARPWRSTGSDFPGFYVPSLDTVTTDLAAAGIRLLEEHEPMPWGCRVVAEDPDGRAVEIIERGHCANRATK